MQDVLNSYKKNHAMETILGDGVHPTSFGHEIIAKEISKVLKEFLIDYQLKHSDFSI